MPTALWVRALGVKLEVWALTIRDVGDVDDDMTEYYGWMDRALPRLFNDARTLLGLG